ncbi:MAG: ABC-type branched-subunit amino acid transport system substrate-binding protein [Halocynthiibacter sp.]|jgi:ABC-type branched-subunit amino acid transport system substrate-binding protein
MFAVLSAARKSISRFALGLSVFALAACDPSAFTLPGAGGSGQKIDTSKPVPVALLVPGGSERDGDNLLAKSLENAARLAMADLGDVKIDLRVYNTAGQAGQAASMATQAVADGAKIILGPVFASAANAAGVAVAPKNVNVLAFSNNASIAGGNVFVLGPTFDNTADRLVSYAVRHGKRNIAIVHGQGTAEEIGSQAIRGAIQRNGATLAGVTGFELSQQAVVAAAPQIASQTKANGAQAVFLTSGNDGALPLLAQLLPENGLTPASMQYIGLQRWDIPATAVSLPGLQGGWFAIPDRALSANFASRYEAAYGAAPLPISGLAYDGIAAIGALAKTGDANALTAAGLTRGSGFVGVNGIFRLRADGSNERGLAIATIQNNQVVEIDPAPRRFGGAGF